MPMPNKPKGKSPKDMPMPEMETEREDMSQEMNESARKAMEEHMGARRKKM